MRTISNDRQVNQGVCQNLECHVYKRVKEIDSASLLP